MAAQTLGAVINASLSWCNENHLGFQTEAVYKAQSEVGTYRL